MRGDFCPSVDVLVEDLMDRVLTQYRESPKLLHMTRTYLRQVGEVYHSVCDLPEMFDLDTAVGEQLTFVGERMGWPRCHCICLTQPVFGFECEGYLSEYSITGFCDGSQTWVDCGTFIDSDICIEDDEIYRQFLKARRYQMLALYSRDDLLAAMRIFWGPTAWIAHSGGDIVVISPGRALTDIEFSLVQLYPRVLPIAPGIRLGFHFGTEPIFGFGEGWGEFCMPQEPRPFVLGDGTPLMTETEPLVTGPLTKGADWLCPINVRTYDCLGIDGMTDHG